MYKEADNHHTPTITQMFLKCNACDCINKIIATLCGPFPFLSQFAQSKKTFNRFPHPNKTKNYHPITLHGFIFYGHHFTVGIT